MQKTCATETVSKMCSQIAAAFEIASCDKNMPVLPDDDEGSDELLITDSVSVEQAIPGRAYRRLQQEVVTRWNSALEMVNSLLSLNNEVTEALKRTGNYDLRLKTLDWNTLAQLSAFLDSFRMLTEVASGGTVGLSVIPLIRAKISTACKTCDSDVDEDRAEKAHFGQTRCMFSIK